MEAAFATFPENELNDLYRQTVVEIMTQILDYWSQTTGKTKIQFAEESGIWTVYLDRDTYQTRTLDKYLNLTILPKNPRLKDVFSSARYVLDTCPESASLKTRLQANLSKLTAINQARKTNS